MRGSEGCRGNAASGDRLLLCDDAAQMLRLPPELNPLRNEADTVGITQRGRISTQRAEPHSAVLL